MTSRPSIGRIRIGLLNTMFSASSSLTWAAVGLPDSRSLRKGCIVIPPLLCYLLLKSSKGYPRGLTEYTRFSSNECCDVGLSELEAMSALPGPRLRTDHGQSTTNRRFY